MFRYIEVHANAIHLIYIGVYPHKCIGHEDNVQTGGVVGVRYMLFNVYLCNHIMLLQVVVGLRARFCALLEVCGGWELGC